MSQSSRFWQWTVFVITLASYVPIMVGGWQHPSEINLASYAVWIMMASMILYSSWDQGFLGFFLPLGFLIGNLVIVAFGLCLGGCTFNLGVGESFGLFGILGTLSVWIAYGNVTKKWSSRILYWGTIITDVISFYPQWKQYLLPHDKPTPWMLVGWFGCFLASAVNIMCVEGLFKKLGKDSHLPWEQSAFSIESCFLTMVTIILMAL